jgi:hypothetical protein
MKIKAVSTFPIDVSTLPNQSFNQVEFQTDRLDIDFDTDLEASELVGKIIDDNYLFDEYRSLECLDEAEAIELVNLIIEKNGLPGQYWEEK